MGLDYKILPISEDRLKAAYGGSPDIYRELIEKYGKEKVDNNYVVDVVLLQEEKAIWDAQGRKLDITKEIIEKTFHATSKQFDKWYMAPINKLKAWMKDSEYLGYSPVLTDHKTDMIDKHGYIVGGSLKLILLPDLKTGKGKLHLIGKLVLMSPEAKYHWALGDWREISPGISAEYIMEEVSFVTIPAQMNNSTFSSGVPGIMEPIKEVGISAITELDIKIQALKEQAVEEKFYNAVTTQEFVAKRLTDELINTMKIPSSKRKMTEKWLLQLSSHQMPLGAEMLGKVAGDKNPLANRPRTYLLKGAIDMGTKDERFAEFQKAKGDSYKDANVMLADFENEEHKYQETLRLASGAGKLELTGSDRYKDLLDMMEKDEHIDDEIKNRVMEMCKTKFGMQLSQPGSVDAGGVTQPNNSANLSGNAPGITDKAQTSYTEVLELGYNTIKQQNADLLAKVTELETKHNNLKTAFEGAK